MDNGGVLGLSVNFFQGNAGQDWNFEEVGQDLAWADRWQLLGIAHDEDLAVGGNVLEELVGQPGVHHGKLIDDDEVGIEIVLSVAFSLVFGQSQMTVDSGAGQTCQLIHTAGCPSCRRRQQNRDFPC